MAAIYSNGGNRWNILGFNFTKRHALSSVYKISMVLIERCTGIAGSIPARDLKLYFRSCSWLGIINAYKFPLDNFHLQYPSTDIQSKLVTSLLNCARRENFQFLSWSDKGQLNIDLSYSIFVS
jgi:hypothetical protein